MGCQEEFLCYSISIMKWPLVLMLLATPSLAYQAPEAGNKHEHPDNATEHKRQEAQKAKESPPAVIEQHASHGEMANEKSQSKTSESAPPSHDWIDRLNALSTSIIAVFTVLLFIGLILQIRTARDTERAWISARPAILSPQLRSIWEQGDPLPALPGWVHLFPVRFLNSGNSPARIDEISIRYVLLESLSALRVPPEYGQPIPQNGFVLVPRERTVFSVPLTTGTDSGMLQRWQLANVQNAVFFLYRYEFLPYSY